MPSKPKNVFRNTIDLPSTQRNLHQQKQQVGEVYQSEFD
jgi:hypothetical protein